jgi:hypothetical protein
MLEQQELVADEPFGPLGGKALLQRVRLAVGHAAEPAGVDRWRLAPRTTVRGLPTGNDDARGLHAAHDSRGP